MTTTEAAEAADQTTEHDVPRLGRNKSEEMALAITRITTDSTKLDVAAFTSSV